MFNQHHFLVNKREELSWGRTFLYIRGKSGGGSRRIDQQGYSSFYILPSNFWSSIDGKRGLEDQKQQEKKTFTETDFGNALQTFSYDL